MEIDMIRTRNNNIYKLVRTLTFGFNIDPLLKTPANLLAEATADILYTIFWDKVYKL